MYQYVHGGDIYSDPTLKQNKEMLDYSANINPLGIPSGVRSAIKAAVADSVNYPDPFCRELRARIGRRFSVPAEMVYCGNGAADVLFRIMTALQPKRTLLLAPAFADYEKAALTVDSKIDYFILHEENGFAVTPEILKAITKRTQMVVLCNPNNPTGKLMDKELLLAVLKHCEELHIPLLIDECFMDFVQNEEEYSLKDQLAAHPGLVILKAFTKIFAIPGVRLGFCLTSDTVLIDKLYACGQDWNVSVLAQAAGVAALEETDYLAETRELIDTEKAYLAAQLRIIGLKVFEGAANYLLIKSLHNYPWPEKLRKHHILIRDCSNYRGLSSGFYRIAVKTRRDNRRLIKIMKELVKHDFFDYIN
ncbi:MAG: aminotransferase class I/II-fold pyridoxal phosphate-dependent enzyme [Acidaminococcaceae bacterium]|nr:aminotransferase class I/II-fold pyridoxal phosphate-dependent enzyme [Acidaminococcaceae bacterium]HBX75873.1 threonine-phosphate decarboxylase [Acidaminococcaceae bacterium]